MSVRLQYVCLCVCVCVFVCLLGGCVLISIVEMCEDSEQKQTFVQRTWKRLIEFQCRQSPFQESGCHAADCWLDGGILHVAVLAQYFGELPFQPLVSKQTHAQSCPCLPTDFLFFRCACMCAVMSCHSLSHVYVCVL